MLKLGGDGGSKADLGFVFVATLEAEFLVALVSLMCILFVLMKHC